MRFAINNPYCDDYNNNVLIREHWKLSTNKNIEFQLNGFDPYVVIEGAVEIHKTDHTGFNIEFGLFGYWFNFVFYDKRHKEDN